MLVLAGLAGASAALPAVGQPAEPANRKMSDAPSVPVDAPIVAMLIHPKLVAQDLIGPLTVLNILRCQISLVWKDKAPCSTDVGIALSATKTFEECPRELDVLLVPGGIAGTIDCMSDSAVLAFLADRGSRARWVASVCTGGLTIAAAGLLKGYDATSHWAVADLLPLMGARRVDSRVVTDRNRMTCAGVTAGIDLGLTLAAELLGEESARMAQLTMEYSPAPPFRSGTPAEAGSAQVASVRSRRVEIDARAKLAAEAAGRRLGVTA